ncbi:uncharacterized protein LOC125959621 [Anopheles darlingi]|nr:uncharacterized protein LOC125959621 [Anopheles darlingi]
MSNIKLYTAKLSPPGRAVELTASLLGLELEIIPINLLAGDHRKPEFLKMNPQHTIPIIDDGGVVIRDSHAIIIYLVQKYGKDLALYPDDPITRAKINAALHFDSGVLFSRLRFYFEPILYGGSSELPQHKIDYMRKGYELLNDALVDDYIVGNTLTLADLSCIATIATMEAFFPLEDRSSYPKLFAWIERISQLPDYDRLNQQGAIEFAEICESLRLSNGTKANYIFKHTMEATTQLKLILYYDDVSPPVRSVMLAVAALNLQDRIEYKYVNLFAGEHLKSDFVKLNPLHTVPVLRYEAEDLTITDSHAILLYLCETFASTGDDLAIDSPVARARVSNRLCFNNGFLFQRDAEVMRKIFRGDIAEISADIRKPLTEAIDVLEQYLQGTKYVAADHLTVADFSIVATVSTLDLILPINGVRWPRVHEWFEVMRALTYYEQANQVGLQKLRAKLCTKVAI